MSDTSAELDADDVLITRDLDRRPSRAPDYEAENRALSVLAEAMGRSPDTVLQRLVEAAMELTRSGSAGISLLEPGGDQGTFRWVATAGSWAPYRNGRMPREDSPCGEVIAREAILLMKNPERRFPALLQANPGIGEGLLAPFLINGVPGGTVWTIKHDPHARFDAEDARLLESLARFASAAHQMVLALAAAETGKLESDGRLRALAEASSDVFYVMSADMTELRQLSGGDFIADTSSPSFAWLEDYIPLEDQERTVAATKEAIRTKSVFELEHRVRQVDGETGWALSRAVPILDPEGRIVEWFGAASDITARKEAEVALGASQARQAFLLKLSDALRAEPSAEAMTERALRMLFDEMRLDRCYVGIYRLAEDRGDFPHQVHDDRLLPLPTQVRLSDFPEALQIAVHRTLVIDDVAAMSGLSDSERAGFDGLGMRALITATLRKGENIPLWAICAVSTGPRVWTKGDVALVEEVAERTWAAVERAKAETALRESQARLTAAFESVPVGVAVIDMSGSAVLSNSEYRRFRPNGLIPSRDGERGARWRAWDDQERLLDPKDYPGARALRGETVVPGQEMLHIDDKGCEIWTTVATAPTRDGTGRVTGAVAVISDIDAVRRAADRLRDSEERLRQFGDASSDVLWIRDAEHLQWTYLTPAFEAIYGLSREEALTGNDFRRWSELIVPEDRDRALANIHRVRLGERVTFEYRIQRPTDGEIRTIKDTDFPIRDAEGRIYAVGGVGHDVTEERAMSDRQDVLLAELQHRTRNLLGVVRSMADKTAEGADSLDDFLPRYRDRIGALARINGLLSKLEKGERVTFEDMLRTELAARGVLDGEKGSGQVVLEGPSGVRLRSATVQTFALAIHELTTNAVKYGALANGRGKLRVRWRVDHDAAGQNRLHVEWVESGVLDMPASGAPPKGGGYGRMLIERALPYQLRATTTYNLGPDGVCCTINLPLS